MRILFALFDKRDSFNITVQLKPSNSFTRYLPPPEDSERWGYRLIDAGRQQVSPGQAYPPPGHPLPYRFDTKKGRALQEFQVVFITRGGGSFQSQSCPASRVESGDALVLFPGEWHRYAPAQDTGWDECWLGFDGPQARQLMEAFFSPKAPVLRGSFRSELIQAFDQLLAWMQRPVPGIEQITASHIPLILALLRAGSQQAQAKSRTDAELVLTAKARLLQNLQERTDLEGIARELGVSYTRLRTLFRQHTGYAPRAFENLIKLNRARDMLASGERNVGATADALGFTSVHYFSRAFKKQFGLAPMDWLRQERGRVEHISR